MARGVAVFGDICAGLADCLGRAPTHWWRRKPPKKQKLCYRRKSDALRAFLDENRLLIDEWGSMEQQESCQEFDAVNHKYVRKGIKCARTVPEAVWMALKGSGQGGGPPYCLDELDLEALNDTDPGRVGEGFRLPAVAQDVLVKREEEAHYEREAIDSGEIDSCHTVYRKKTGRFSAKRNGRIRQCVCRKKGRFVKCGDEPEPSYTDEVPF
jgi:hypothetical protein